MKSIADIIGVSEPIPAKMELTRDAIHVPVIIVRAHTYLRPGDRVGIDGNSTTSYKENKPNGVVDPFRNSATMHGEMVIVLLRPGSVENVRHEWAFPAKRPLVVEFMVEQERKQLIEPIGAVDPNEAAVNFTEALEQTAKILECDKQTIVDAIWHIQNTGSTMGGSQPGIPEEKIEEVDWSEFWKAYNAAHPHHPINSQDDPFCCGS